MQKFILLILLTITCYGRNNTYKELVNEYHILNTDQVRTMMHTFRYGMKHNLSWSLTAVAWKESKFGIFKLPLDDRLDRGLCQINLKTYFKRHDIKNTRWNRSKYGTKLVVDDDHNLDAAIMELRYWENQKKSWESYRKVWMGYNGGFSKSKASKEYAADIAMRIKVLRTEFKK